MCLVVRSPYDLGITDSDVPSEWCEAIASASPRQVLYACVRPKSIVWGKVVQSLPQGISVKILSVVACDRQGETPRRWSFSQSENVIGHCSRLESCDGQLYPVLPLEYPVGASVMTTVVSVQPASNSIVLSMKNSKMLREESMFPPYKGNWGSLQVDTYTPSLGHAHQTPPGGPDRENFTWEQQKKVPTPYLQLLECDSDFGSPHSLRAMQRAYGLVEGCSVMKKGTCSVEMSVCFRKYLEGVKTEVRKAWATESVRRGVPYAKGGDYATALKCYEQALELDPRHTDAYVARGAVFANQSRFRDAAVDFERALEIDPSDENAKKYLITIKEKHPEACKRLPSASTNVSTCTTHKSASAALSSIDERVSPRGRELNHGAADFEDNGANVGKGDGGGMDGGATVGPMLCARTLTGRKYNAELERELAAAVEERKRKKKEKDRDREKAKRRKKKKGKNNKKRRHSSSSDSDT